jgi:hypothetical protein
LQLGPGIWEDRSMFRAIRLAGALAPWIWWASLVPAPAGAAEPLLYGGIEIGAKGIKVVAVPIEDNGTPDLSRKVLNLPHVAVNNVTLADRDARGNFRADAIVEAGAAVADFHRQLRQNLKIPPERLWVVASSGLTIKGEPGNMDELRAAVSKATGGEEILEEIDQRREVELLVRGVIPRAHWRDAILLDVGSGNAKIGYVEPAVGINVEKFQVLSTRVDGTVSLTKSIQAEMTKRRQKGFAAFCTIANELRGETEERITDDLGRTPGLKSRPRVYISGGATWAIATLTYPEEVVSQDLYLKLSLKDLRQFHDRLRTTGKVTPPDLEGLPLNVRDKAEKEIRNVLDVFTAENLLAGSEILLEFANVLDWEDPGKELFFAKSGVVAWIVGYVELERKKGK